MSQSRIAAFFTSLSFFVIAALVAGVVVAVAMVATARFVQKPAGAFVGWMLQLIVLASALLVPAMALVVLIFGGMWVYARVQGPRIEARMAASEGE